MSISDIDTIKLRLIIAYESGQQTRIYIFNFVYTMFGSDDIIDLAAKPFSGVWETFNAVNL